MSASTATARPASAGAGLRVERDGARTVLHLSGRLDVAATGRLWREALDAAGDGPLVADLTGLDALDGSGASLLAALAERQRAGGLAFELSGLRDDHRALLDLLGTGERRADARRVRPEPLVAWLGRAALEVAGDVRELVAFIGETCLALGEALVRPGRVRWRDVIAVAENAGIGAVPIVAVIGFLLGLILSFQSAIPMQRFGAEIFVSDLIGISMLRELGPLMAAIMLTARSGSAFAAELGTMRVNQEVDALTTMGLQPVRFLVVPRVLAALAVVPVLTMIVSLAGLVGSACVMVSLGYPVNTFLNRVVAASSVSDLMGGLAKAVAFGLVVAGVGCLRGLQTGTGAGAVGASTTRSVVSGIILIAVLDGGFAVLFYVMGW